MPKEKCNIAIYIRTKEGSFAIFGNSEQVIRKHSSIRRMTTEQRVFCEKMKSEFETRKYSFVK